MKSPTLGRAEIAEIALQCTVHDLDAGETIFERGEAGDCMYIVESGQVEVLFDDGRPPKPLGPCSYFGELALIAGKHGRTATVRCCTPTRLIKLDPDHFDTLLHANPTFFARLVRRSCIYLIAAEQQLIADLTKRNEELERTLEFLRRTQEELDAAEIDARTDRLTGLHNRRSLMATIPKLIDRAPHVGGLALLLIDLDFFKQVNDSHGHQAGDKVLETMGRRIRAKIRRTDLPCRIGGDEFAIVLSDIGIEDAEARACGIYEGVGSFEVDDLPVTCTMGGTAWEPGESWDHLFKRADEALYVAKESGRACLAWNDKVVLRAPKAP